MTEGKAISGGYFYPPPAAIWNNMIDAGRAWSDNRLNNGEGQPIRPRETDIIKLQNTSGSSRRLGEVLKIEGKAITTVSDEHIWLLGVEPTADCYFGILKRPMRDDEIDQVQVSGCCMALVDIQDVDHRRADIVDGEYVLKSSDSGPIEILYAPESTGEQTCVVRFGGGGSGGETQIINFQIVSSDPATRSALVQIEQRAFTGPAYGSLLEDSVVDVYDTDGCYLNEPNVDLTSRRGKAVLMYTDDSAAELHFPNEYNPPEKYWCVLTICCPNVSCETV